MDYKKILEGVVDIINTTEKSDIGFANICTYIGENCPELKSEDERARYVLIDYFNRYKEQEECGIKTFFGIPTDNILAWLKKQEDKDKLIKELGEYKVKYTQEVLEKHINSVSNKDEERLRKTTIAFLKDFADKGYENAVECIDWLENMGGQKPADNETKELLRTEYEKGRADALAEVHCLKSERNPDRKDETLTKLIEEIDKLDEERKQNVKYKSAKSGFAHTVRHFFLSNEIKTLDELLSLGRKHVARCRNIGKMTMWAIDKALENLYGITEW